MGSCILVAASLLACERVVTATLSLRLNPRDIYTEHAARILLHVTSAYVCCAFSLERVASLSEAGKGASLLHCHIVLPRCTCEPIVNSPRVRSFDRCPCSSLPLVDSPVPLHAASDVASPKSTF